MPFVAALRAGLLALVNVACVLNETILLSSAWIISPSALGSDGQRHEVFALPPPLWTAVAYGVLEPVFTALVLRLPSPLQPVNVLQLLPHAHGAGAYWCVSKWVERGGVSRGLGRYCDVEGGRRDEMGDLEGRRSWISVSVAHVRRGWLRVKFFVLPLVTAAVSNAALLLVPPSYEAKSKAGEESKAMTWFLMGALAWYFGSWGADAWISNVTEKAYIIGQRWRDVGEVVEQLKCLLVMVVVRSAVRWMLGLGLWLGRPEVSVEHWSGQ